MRTRPGPPAALRRGPGPCLAADAPNHAAATELAHQALYRAAYHLDIFPVELLSDLVGDVGTEVLVPHTDNLELEFRIPACTSGQQTNVRLAGLVGVVGGRSDRQLRANRLDLETIDVSVDLGHHQFRRRSTSAWAKYAKAVLGNSARSAIDRITAVLPDRLRAEILQAALFSPPSEAKFPITVDLSAIRRAIRTRNRIRFDYLSLKYKRTRRKVRPLCLPSFGPVWLLSTWCETLRDFRSFRLDRMRRLTVLDDRFGDEPGKRLADFLRRERAKR